MVAEETTCPITRVPTTRAPVQLSLQVPVPSNPRVAKAGAQVEATEIPTSTTKKTSATRPRGTTPRLTTCVVVRDRIIFSRAPGPHHNAFFDERTCALPSPRTSRPSAFSCHMASPPAFVWTRMASSSGVCRKPNSLTRTALISRCGVTAFSTSSRTAPFSPPRKYSFGLCGSSCSPTLRSARHDIRCSTTREAPKTRPTAPSSSWKPPPYPHLRPQYVAYKLIGC